MQGRKRKQSEISIEHAVENDYGKGNSELNEGRFDLERKVSLPNSTNVCSIPRDPRGEKYQENNTKNEVINGNRRILIQKRGTINRVCDKPATQACCAGNNVGNLCSFSEGNVQVNLCENLPLCTSEITHNSYHTQKEAGIRKRKFNEVVIVYTDGENDDIVDRDLILVEGFLM